MGAQTSTPVTVHGLRFPAETLTDESGALPQSGFNLGIEFSGVAIEDQNSHSVLALIPYNQIVSWSHSESNHRIGFKVNLGGGEMNFWFRVRDAKAVEAAIMARIEVFLDDNLYAARVLADPTGNALPTGDCELHISETGLTVKDPTGRMGDCIFKFTRLQAWGRDHDGALTLDMPQGKFKFIVKDAAVIIRKLTDIASMIAHSEDGHAHSHSTGSSQPVHWYEVDIVQDPLGVGLPKKCALRVLDDSIKLLGRGSKSHLTIRISSMAGWSQRGADLLIKLTPEKGSHVFSFGCADSESCAACLKELTAAAQALAATMKSMAAGVPPPPAGHPPREQAPRARTDTQGQMVTLTLPANAKPGARLTIKIGGESYNITVPAGAVPGSQVRMKLPAAQSASPPPPPPAQQQDQLVAITLPANAVPGQSLNINVGGQQLRITVPQGSRPGQVVHMKLPAAAAAVASRPPPPAGPPQLRSQSSENFHELTQWPAAAIEATRSLLGEDVSVNKVKALLDMASGDVNRAADIYFQGLEQEEGVPPPPPPPPAAQAASTPPAGALDGRALFMAANSHGDVLAAQRELEQAQAAAPATTEPETIFKASSYPENEETFGFPEDVVLDTSNGTLSILEEDTGDDMAAWPADRVIEWKKVGLHDVSIRVPEGVMIFGVDNPDAFLNALAVANAYAS